MTSMSLAFQNTTFTVTDRDGQHWLRASEIAQALGYANNDAVGKLYDRNADEFTGSMTQVIEIPVTPNSTVTKNLQNKVRIFSLRGCHLLAMFARTAVAKEFRKWVLDVLDREVAEQAINSRKTITPEQQAELHAIVESRGQGNRGVYAEMWSRHNRHFKIAKYSQLLQVHFDESKAYLQNMDLKAKLLPAPVVTIDPVQLRLASEVSLLMTSQLVPLLAQSEGKTAHRFLVSVDTMANTVFARPMTNQEVVVNAVELMEGHSAFSALLRKVGLVECAAFAKLAK